MLSTTHSALVAQSLAHAIGDALQRPIDGSCDEACVALEEVVWAQEGVLHMPLPRLWAFGSPGVPSLLQHTAAAAPLPGTVFLPGADDQLVGAVQQAEHGHGICFAVREALVIGV
jgi:hypothetical protein